MTEKLELKSTDDGTVLPVRIVPRASRTEIDGVRDGALRVRVKAPPVDGAANAALCTFLAKVVGVPKREVAITSGERGRSKSVSIAGVTPDEVLRSLLGDTG